MKTAVAFLWHMHQPFYKDMLTGIYRMPWVRFHSIKAYYDMISILEDFPQIRMNFNLVPSLLVQIQDYISGQAKDSYWDLSLKPAKGLSLADKNFILLNFFMANWETMIKPYPRYWDLLQKRGTKVSEENIANASEKYSTQDFTDLQVWFNLTWFGYRARKKYPQLQKLITKGGSFTDLEKKEVLDTQIAIIKELLPCYREAQKEGRIEITTTPFYHPIMPLLYDTDFARRSMPGVVLPQRFAHPEDVSAQLKLAVSLYKKIFGKNPRGLWPSEGSVCPELIPLIAERGIKWLATDEEILLKTVNIEDKGKALYKPYKFCREDKCLQLVFRDKGISNALSFIYPRQDPHAAARELIHNLHNINEYLSNENGPSLVTIALDGENPWEYYCGGGEPFLKELLESLSNDSALYTTTISDYLEKYPAQEILPGLHSGSWINHDFDIWIGEQEENTAWEYLEKTRQFLKNNEKELAKQQRDLAWQNLYAAEGSDWFWWYGDDFQSDCDEEFDILFRTHLANVYKVLDYEVPEFLRQPVILTKEVQAQRAPYAFISPVIDGQNTHFYEWADAGFFKAERPGGKFYKGESYLSAIYFGFDLNNLYIRIDPLVSKEEIDEQKLTACLNIINRNQYQISFPLIFKANSLTGFMVSRSVDGVHFEKRGQFSTIKADKILELSVPFAALELQAGEPVRFFVQIQKGKKQLDRYPHRGYISFQVPDEEFELDKWLV